MRGGSRRLLVAALLALSCAPAPVVQEAPVAAAPDEGPLPLSLQPHFACGPDELRRSEAEVAMKRAARSLGEAEQAQGVDQATLKRLGDDRATAERNRDDAARSFDECSTRVLASRRERLATADTRRVAEIRAIAAEERLDREKVRVKQDDERMAALMRDQPGKVMAPIVSTLLCATVAARAKVAEELATLQAAPKKQAKQNKPKVEELTGRVKAGDGLVAALEQELAKTGSAQIPCETPAITALGDCLVGRAGGDKPAACADAGIDDAILAWDSYGVGEKLKDAWASDL